MDINKTRLQLSVQFNGNKVIERSFVEFPVVFGRSKDCHVSLGDYGFVSGVHGAINVDKNSISISDLDSKNGIIHGGKRVQSFSFAEAGEFVVGELKFQLKLVESAEETDLSVNWTNLTSPVVKLEKKVNEPPSDVKIRTLKKSKPEFVPPPAPTSVTTPTSPTVRTSITAPTSTLQFSLEPDARAARLPAEDICLQGVITWMGDVFDVRQFYPGDWIRIGPHPSEPIFIPCFLHQIVLGRAVSGKAIFNFSKSTVWQISQQRRLIDPQDLKVRGQLSEANGKVKLQLNQSEVLSIDLGNDLELHLRYVEIPRPLVSKNWIENKEEYKSAIRISSAIHVVIAVALFFGAPKVVAPKIDNVPPRFARLIVEPPKQVFVPPPPIVEEKPIVKAPEPPEPKVEEKVVEKKVVEKKVAPKPKKIAEKKSKPQPQKEKIAPVVPQKSQEDQFADSFASAFSEAPAKSKVDVKNIQVNKTAAPTNVSPTNLMKTLSSKNGRLPASTGESALNNKLGAVGFATGGLSGKAGAQEIKGLVVGKPSLSSSQGKIQGLNNKEIMKVVNQHVGAIQQCYERSLLNNSSLSGRVEFEWTIASSGKVTEAAVKQSELSGGEQLQSCVIDIIRGMTFPNSKNGQSTVATIGFPFGRN